MEGPCEFEIPDPSSFGEKNQSLVRRTGREFFLITNGSTVGNDDERAHSYWRHWKRRGERRIGSKVTELVLDDISQSYESLYFTRVRLISYFSRMILKITNTFRKSRNQSWSLDTIFVPFEYNFVKIRDFRSFCDRVLSIHVKRIRANLLSIEQSVRIIACLHECSKIKRDSKSSSLSLISISKEFHKGK